MFDPQLGRFPLAAKGQIGRPGLLRRSPGTSAVDSDVLGDLEHPFQVITFTKIMEIYPQYIENVTVEDSIPNLYQALF
jgi:hypothetical protein